MINGFKPKGLIQSRDSLYLIKIIKKISRLLGINSCFTRTLCFRSALTLSDFKLKIFIGVREVEGRVLSHCWAETRVILVLKIQLKIHHLKLLRSTHNV